FVVDCHPRPRPVASAPHREGDRRRPGNEVAPQPRPGRASLKVVVIIPDLHVSPTPSLSFAYPSRGLVAGAPPSPDGDGTVHRQNEIGDGETPPYLRRQQ
ncbi:hypothetical protein BHM03_00048175, partial [Ensete ventricosum]